MLPLTRLKKQPKDTTLGRILLDLHFITRDQLRAAITAKHEAHGEKLLGEILIAIGAITRDQLDRAIQIQTDQRGGEVDYAARLQHVVASATAALETVGQRLMDLEALANRVSASVDSRPTKVLHLRAVGPSVLGEPDDDGKR